MGGGSCQWRHESGDTFTADYHEQGKLACKWHKLAPCISQIHPKPRIGEGRDEAERVSDVGNDFFIASALQGAREHHTDTLQNATRAPFQHWAREYADGARCQGGIEIRQTRWQRQTFKFVLYACRVASAG